MDSLYLYNKYGTPISYELWSYLRRLTDWVCDHWHDKDDAIWEVRGGPRDFVYSKMMCWVAVDRAMRLASKRSFPADWNRLDDVRDEIYETVMQRGWSDKRGAFRATVTTGDALDASLCSCRWCFSSRPPIRACSAPSTPSTTAQGGRTSFRWPGVSLRRREDAGRIEGHGRDIQYLHLLAGGGADPRQSAPIRSGCRKPACCSSRCSAMPIIWACTPSRSATRARRSAIFRTRSRICR